MRIGVVGVGRIGVAHADVLRAHPRVTGLLLADADAGRAREVADKLDVTAADTVEAAFTGTDAVVIAAPTPAHEELIGAALRAQVPVFCEKPVATDVEGTLRVAEAVRRAGVPVQIGFQRRFDAGYLAAKRALADGEIGTLHRVHMVTADPAPPPASYIATSGGMFRDCHVHDFDILRWLTGREVVQVFAMGANRGEEFFVAAGDVDNSTALLRLDDGTLVTLAGSRYNGHGYDARTELAGSLATHVVGLDDRTPIRSSERAPAFPAGDPWPTFHQRFGSAYVAEMSAFLDVAAGTAASPCTVAEALEALYVAEAAELSRLEGRVVDVAEVRR